MPVEMVPFEAGGDSRRPTFEDLARLHYTKQVFQEVMRLYPPGWFLPRFTDRETVIGGQRIPAGSTILLSAFVSQRDPSFWPDPEVFDPGESHVMPAR